MYLGIWFVPLVSGLTSMEELALDSGVELV